MKAFEVATPASSLQELLQTVGLPEAAARVRFGGSDPVVRTRFLVGTAGGAMLAAVAAAAAELWKVQTGREQSVEMDLRLAAESLRCNHYFSLDGVPWRELAPLSPWRRAAPVRGGRWIWLHTQHPHHFEVAREVLGGAFTFEEACAKTLEWDGGELETVLNDAGSCAGLVRTLDEWERHPQGIAVARQPLIEIAKIGDGPRIPLSGSRPLGGIKVLDLTRMIAGPTCAKTLAEHGACVLKVLADHLSTQKLGDIEAGIGKLSTFIDLRAAAGVATLDELVRDADVFVQGYRPGTLAARGFGPEALARKRPGIVYTELSAWGNSGPWSDRRGYDSIVQSVSGMVDVQSAGAEATLVPVPVIDYVTGYLMALGTIVALGRRAREGGSWHVRTSLARTARWIVARGLLEPDAIAGVTEIAGDVVAPYVETRDSPAGRVRFLGPVVAMSDTKPSFEHPPVPLGYHQPKWPA